MMMISLTYWSFNHIFYRLTNWNLFKTILFPVRKSDSRRPKAWNSTEERTPQQEEEEAEGRRHLHQFGDRQEDQRRIQRNARPAKTFAATSTRSWTSPAPLRVDPETGAAEEGAGHRHASSDRAQVFSFHLFSEKTHGLFTGSKVLFTHRKA